MRLFLCLAALVFAVAGCATKQPYASDAEIAKVAYVHPGPKSLTLYTMVNNRTGGGGHSALLINASQRVIFDPAGSFYSELVPERNDVLFGITPRLEKGYRSGHARSTYHVVSQTLEVSPQQAEAAYRMALGNGAVPGAYCANATSTILGSILGSDAVTTTFYPNKLSDQFALVPGVVTEKYYENDDDRTLKEGIVFVNEALAE